MAGTYTVLDVKQRNGIWRILVQLDALGESTRLRFRYEVLPPPAERDAILQGYADDFEQQVIVVSNPLNKYKSRIENPLVEHTRDVFRFIVQGIIDFPGATLAQALAALVAEFPDSPYGDFTAFVLWVRTQSGGMSWDDFKTYVLANSSTFDPEQMIHG